MTLAIKWFGLLTTDAGHRRHFYKESYGNRPLETVALQLQLNCQILSLRSFKLILCCFVVGFCTALL